MHEHDRNGTACERFHLRRRNATTTSTCSVCANISTATTFSNSNGTPRDLDVAAVCVSLCKSANNVTGLQLTYTNASTRAQRRNALSTLGCKPLRGGSTTATKAGIRTAGGDTAADAGADPSVVAVAVAAAVGSVVGRTDTVTFADSMAADTGSVAKNLGSVSSALPQ